MIVFIRIFREREGESAMLLSDLAPLTLFRLLKLFFKLLFLYWWQKIDNLRSTVSLNHSKNPEFTFSSSVIQMFVLIEPQCVSYKRTGHTCRL